MRLRFALRVSLLLALAAPLAPAAAQQRAPSFPRATRAVRRDLPLGPMIRRAYAAHTRDSSGTPGPRYWQQQVDYSIDARLDVDSAVLHGEESITLHNSSPDTLGSIVLRLYQNYFRAEEARNDYVTDITDGVIVERLVVNGAPVKLDDPRAYAVDGTVARVALASPILPGAEARIAVQWHFAVPNVPSGVRGERMGRWGTDLYQIAQWYPQVAMYDDLRGWDTDQYLGKGEFYNQFGRFDVRITLPAGWLVGATGTLANPEEVLSPTTRERLALAMHADSTVHVVTAAERGAGTATTAGASLTWHFTAPMVNDFAFVASKSFVYDATHAMAPNPTLVQVLYLPEHQAYARTAQIARFALEQHAKTVMPYDFPQATVADGPETGMEYPMIIFSGAGFGVVTHELGHEWFPMMVGSNETWYGWQDEGFNEYIDGIAAAAYRKAPADDDGAGAAYRQIAGSELEAPMMWPSDFAGPYYEIQAYVKAPLALRALGGVVGDSAVREAFAAYAQAWRYKHPSPWDFFTFMDHRLGTELGWFWNAWWFTTQTFDQAIAGVAPRTNSVAVTVEDHGDMAMPIILRVEYDGGRTETLTRPASVWFGGARTAVVSVPLGGKRIARLTLDPENRFQDLDRSNNVWTESRAAR
jgi:hypothetical protein